MLNPVVLGWIRFKHGLRICRLCPITNADSTVGANKDVPGVDPEAKDGLGINGPLVLLEESVEGVGINELVQGKQL